MNQRIPPADPARTQRLSCGGFAILTIVGLAVVAVLIVGVFVEPALVALLLFVAWFAGWFSNERR